MNGTLTIIIVFCSLAAYEELSESSQEDIKVDERRHPSFCPSFLPQNICLSLWGIALTRFSSHFCIVCLEKNFVHQSLIYGNFDVSCPSIWLRTQMMMIGLQNTSSPVEQCLQLIYFFISRSVLYPFFSFFWTCDTSVLSTSSNKFMYRTMFLLLITGLWMESIMHKPGS